MPRRPRIVQKHVKNGHGHMQRGEPFGDLAEIDQLLELGANPNWDWLIRVEEDGPARPDFLAALSAAREQMVTGQTA
jgi:hypothetical protein